MFSQLLKPLLPVLLLVTGNVAMGQRKSQKSETAATLTYLKKEKDGVYFNVEISNPSRNKLAIAIDSEEGEKLFKSAYNNKKINRTFRAPIQNGRITVLVTDEETKNVVGYFEISPDANLIEEILITKL